MVGVPQHFLLSVWCRELIHQLGQVLMGHHECLVGGLILALRQQQQRVFVEYLQGPDDVVCTGQEGYLVATRARLALLTGHEDETLALVEHGLTLQRANQVGRGADVCLNPWGGLALLGQG